MNGDKAVIDFGSPILTPQRMRSSVAGNPSLNGTPPDVEVLNNAEFQALQFKIGKIKGRMNAATKVLVAECNSQTKSEANLRHKFKVVHEFGPELLEVWPYLPQAEAME